MTEPTQAELTEWLQTHCYHCRSELPRNPTITIDDLQSCSACFARLNLGPLAPVDKWAVLMGGHPVSKGTHAQAEQESRLRLVRSVRSTNL